MSCRDTRFFVSRPVPAALPVLGLTLAVTVALAAGPGQASAATINVPNDHATVQAAINAATAGDTVEVETGVYNERVTFPASGTAGNPIVLQAKAGHSPVLDGTGIAVNGLTGMVFMEDRSYIHVVGLEIRNYTASGSADFPSGIWVRGQGTGIELRDNVVHTIENNGCGNCGAHGIAVYGTRQAGSIDGLVVDGNTVRDCVLGWSEAMVLNGNVENFTVSNNTVHDNNNIGIDMIGFEGECVGCPDSLDRARDGVVSGNLVYNIDSQGNPAYGNERSADGIYVDGGTRIVIEKNTVHDVNIGIEIASEHGGKDTSEITIRNNFVYDCHTTGIAMGGYDRQRGSSEDNYIVGNTLYNNDTDQNDNGELLVQYDTRNNTIANNIFYANSQNVFIANWYSENTGNVVDYNLYFSSGGEAASQWAWKDSYYEGFANWQSSTGNDANSQFVDPQLVNAAAGDLHLGATSPAIDAGQTLGSTVQGTDDIDGDVRVNGAATDQGADEGTACGDNVQSGSEECDDGNLVDGDGCDSNCTDTACGNGILTAGEQCDDSNTDDGDCCSASCQFETAGSNCDDAQICTLTDECDGAGTCVGTLEVDPSCLAPEVGRRGAQLTLRDGANGRDKLDLKWGKGPEVLMAALGDPTNTDDYALCIYTDEGAAASLLLGVRAPAGGEWQQKGSFNLKYKDNSLTPDGVKQIQIKAGVAGKAKAKLKAQGANLDVSGLGFNPSTTVTAELRNLSNGTCLGAAFTSPFKKDLYDRFQDKTD